MKLFGTMEIRENELFIGGVSTVELVKKYKSPLYVMDEQLLRDTCRNYYKSFKCNEDNRVAFAGKAFLTLEMCRLIHEEGLNLDVVSGGELYTAYKAGFPMEKIYFHGNNKTLDEIQLGVEKRVGRFVVDNLEEMEMINEIAAKHGVIQDIYLRLTPGIEAHTHEYIQTGQIDSKFGFAPVGNTIMEAVKHALSLANLRLIGLHCHIGSQIFEIKPYEDAAEIMLNHIAEIKRETGHEIKELDLGGGFGVYYTEADKPRSIEEYCSAILNKVDETCERLGLAKPVLTIEPGRSIVGNAGTTLYTIGAIKNIENVRKYVSVDGGMTDNIRPALYEAKYDMSIVNKLHEPADEKVTIAGKCCESGDILLKDAMMPEIKVGDTLAVLATGAYNYSMASNYNRIPRAAVVAVSDGKAKVVVKRESYDDLIKNDVL